MIKDYKSQGWFEYLDHSMRDLVGISVDLLEQEEERKREGSRQARHDYSFVVFPMAKAYEGFLKKLFFEMGLIKERHYKSRYFRIGKSLNPDLPVKYRNEEWVYDRLSELCGQKGIDDLAEAMWQGWRKGRNKLFHYFPQHKNFIGLDEARIRVEALVEVMEQAVECGMVGGQSG